jgi:Transposase IS66 family
VTGVAQQLHHVARPGLAVVLVLMWQLAQMVRVAQRVRTAQVAVRSPAVVHQHAFEALQDANAQMLEELYQVKVSPATVLQWVDEAEVIVTPSVDKIVVAIRQSSTVHADESGLRVAGKLQWLHTAVTETLTWYGVHAKRGMQAIKEHAVLIHFKGVLVHDCLAAYWLLKCTHALCDAHLLRELQFALESTQQAWAKTMMDVLLECNRVVQKAGQNQVALPAQTIKELTARYESALAQGCEQNPEQVKPAGPEGQSRGRVKQEAGQAEQKLQPFEAIKRAARRGAAVHAQARRAV